MLSSFFYFLYLWINITLGSFESTRYQTKKGYIIAEANNAGFIYSNEELEFKKLDSNVPEKYNLLDLKRLAQDPNTTDIMVSICYQQCYHCFCDHDVTPSCKMDCSYCDDWDWYCPDVCNIGCCEGKCSWDCCCDKYPSCGGGGGGNGCSQGCCAEKYPCQDHCSWECCQKYHPPYPHPYPVPLSGEVEKTIVTIDCNPVMECNCEFGNFTQACEQQVEELIFQCNQSLNDLQANCNYNQSYLKNELQSCQNNVTMTEWNQQQCNYNQTFLENEISQCMENISMAETNTQQCLYNQTILENEVLQCENNISLLQDAIQECNFNTGDINCSSACTNDALQCTLTCINFCIIIEACTGLDASNCTSCIMNCQQGCVDQQNACQASNCGPVQGGTPSRLDSYAGELPRIRRQRSSLM